MMGYTCNARMAPGLQPHPHRNFAEQASVRERDTTIDPPPSRSAFPSAPVTPDDDPQAKGLRDGLPDAYRSRHDVHYVEQLSASPESQPVRLIPLARIDAPPLPDERTLGELTRSVSEFGVLQPLLVR